MNIKHDGVEIEAEDLITHLETYAKAVMHRMQKADTEFSDCWTACVITFNDLQPEFQFGSIEDMDEDYGIYVEMPNSLTHRHRRDNE